MRLTPEQIKRLTPEGRKEFLRASHERVVALARQREEEALKIEEEKNVNLPYWQNERRGTPNAFLRSALFAAIQDKDREYLRDTIIYAQNGIEVKFTGEQLNQQDLTVWQTLVHLLRFNSVETRCIFRGYELLQAIGISDGKKNYESVQKSIDRLTLCRTRIKTEKYSYIGGLINSYIVENSTQKYSVSLDKEAIKLYSSNDWEGINWNQRLQLRGKPLAQALHSYYSSHREPFPVSLAMLKEITGSKVKQDADFKRRCRTALDDLVEIGFLKNGEISKNIVLVDRTK
jgi:TrfA protein